METYNLMAKAETARDILLLIPILPDGGCVQEGLRTVSELHR